MRCGQVEIREPFATYLKKFVDRWSSKKAASDYLTQARLTALEAKVSNPKWLAKQQRQAKRAERLRRQNIPEV